MGDTRTDLSRVSNCVTHDNGVYIKVHLSLYSIAMQNCYRWVLVLDPTPQFRIGDTNMLLSKEAKICFKGRFHGPTNHDDKRYKMANK